MQIADITQRISHAARLSDLYYGWWVVVAASILLALMAGPFFHGSGAFLSALEEEFGWTRTVLAGAFAFSRMEGGIVGPISGYLTNRIGAARMVVLGYSIMGLGYLLFSFVNNIPMFYIAFITIAVGAGLGGFIPAMTVVTRWFVARRSTAMAIAMAGTSIGGLLVSPMAWSMSAFGWRETAIGVGVIVVLVALPLSRVLRRAPDSPPRADSGRAGDRRRRGGSGEGRTHQATGQRALASTSPGRAGEEQGRDFTLGEALRTRVFWFLAFAHTATNMSLAAVIVHSVQHLRDVGVSLSVAGTVVTTYTAVALGFQLLGGVVGDRFNKRYLLSGFVAIQAGAVLLFAFTDTLIIAFVFAVLFGIGFGGRGPLMHSIRADYFGQKAFATITGIYNIPLNLGMVTAPLIVGILFDLQHTYRYGMLFVGVFALIGAILVLGATRPAPPTYRRTPSAGRAIHDASGPRRS